MRKEYISFDLTSKEKYERAIKVVKEKDYIEIYSNRGVSYGRIVSINPERISIELEGRTKHFLWTYIDSITKVMT